MRNRNKNQVRIIAGKWRGRKINFLDKPSLRPTPNRVRETLFNWLAPIVKGANCLDLFAGSGALSLEALSRGAHHVVIIDHDLKIIASIKEALVHLNAIYQATLLQSNIPKNSPTLSLKFDIVFIDPPFGQELVLPSCAWLVKHNLLKPSSLVYIETDAMIEESMLPQRWKIVRHKKIGGVLCYLARCEDAF